MKNITYSVRVTFWENGDPVVFKSKKITEDEQTFERRKRMFKEEIGTFTMTDEFGFITTIGPELIRRSVIGIWIYSEEEVD